MLELQNTNSALKTPYVVFDLALRYKHCSTATDSGIGLDNFIGCLSCKMSCSNAKKLINWHTDGKVRGMQMGICWETGHSTLKRNISSADIAAWRGSSLIQHSQSWTRWRNLALLLLRWSASVMQKTARLLTEADFKSQKEQCSSQRRFKESSRGGEGEVGT